jgi:O-antigen/teichoic acid export membrane protein
MPLIFFLMIVIIFLMGFRLEALIWVTVLMAITSVVISFIFINKRLFAGIKNVKPEIEKEKLWRFSFPMYFNNLMDKTKMFIPIFLTGYFLSNEDIGIYNISFKIALLVSFSLGAFRDIFSPSISSLFAKGNKKLIEDLYKTVTKWVFSISLVSFFLIFLFSEPLLSVFGKEFISGANILLLLLFGELLNASGGLARSIIVMSGRPKVALFNSVVTVLLIFVLCYFLIPAHGISGTAMSYLITMFVLNALRIIELYMFEKIHPFKSNYYKPVLAAFAAYFILYFSLNLVNLNPYLEIILGSAIFAGLFAGFIRLLQLDPEDKYVLDMIFDKLKRNKN